MKVFASDLDGTLFFHHLNPQHKPEDLEAILNWKKEGHLFGCCTGRSLKGATASFVDFLDLDFYIVSSGALITDGKMNVIYDRQIPYETAKAIYEYFKDKCEVLIQSIDYLTLNPEKANPFFHYIERFEEVKGLPLYGLCLVHQNHDRLSELKKEFDANFTGVVGYQNIDAIDIVASGCSKGNAVKKVKELFNAEMSYGIGDSYNDIPLLEKADISFTFHSSPDEVKQAATYVVDGIEEAMKMILNEK